MAKGKNGDVAADQTHVALRHMEGAILDREARRKQEHGAAFAREASFHADMSPGGPGL